MDQLIEPPVMNVAEPERTYAIAAIYGAVSTPVVLVALAAANSWHWRVLIVVLMIIELAVLVVWARRRISEGGS